MKTVFKLIHYMAICAFVGSVFGHIVLGLSFSVHDLPSYLAVLRAKAVLTDVLIFGGIAMATLSGLGLIGQSRMRWLRQPWLWAKLLLVALITVNAAKVLRPLGLEKIRVTTDTINGLPGLENLAALTTREDIFGTLNMLMVIVIMVLSMRKQLPFWPTKSMQPAQQNQVHRA